jgi:hypothetical protein
MYIPSSLKITALGFALSSTAIAQSPPAAPPVPPAAAPGLPPAYQQTSQVTQSSRVRAFSAGPVGEMRSLYLQNGSVVDLTPALGGQLGPAIHKGEKITVTGTKSEINGQSLVEAASVRLNDQTFSANAPMAIPLPPPGPLAEAAVPPTPGAPQAPPSSLRRRTKAAAPAPCEAPVDPPPPPPGFGGPPPPPPDGIAPPPPPPDGMPPPPPPQN